MKTLARLLIPSLMLIFGGHLFAQPYMVSDSQGERLETFGTGGDGTTHDFRCPPWYTLGTIDVIHDGTHVNGVKFACSELRQDGSMDNGLVLQQQLGYPSVFGSNSGSLIYRDCYPHLWTGIHGRTDGRIHKLGGYCGDITDVTSGLRDDSKTLSAVGGSGGAPDSAECPRDEIPTGATVTVADGGHIEGIELVCGKVYGPGGPLVGELGLLDLAANGGVNPATGAPWQYGDQYHLAFVSSEPTGGYETSIGDYNAFAQRRAQEAGYFVDWRVIGSTASVAARDNTSTNPGVDGSGIAIFSMDGTTKIADNYSDLWDGTVDAHIAVNEKGEAQWGAVFGGSNNNGTSRGNGRVLGGSSESPPRVTIGNTTKGLNRWMVQYNASAYSHLPVYALSEPLTVRALPDGVPVIYFTPYVDTVSVPVNGSISYPTVSCFDDFDTGLVATPGPAISTSQPGLYTRTYTCEDSAGHTRSKDFTVLVTENSHGTRVDEIYTRVTGEAISPDNAPLIEHYSSRIDSGDMTCTDLVDELIALAGLNADEASSYYFECETGETRRSGEILAQLCPDGIADCVLSQDHGQLMKLDSFGVEVDRGFLGWRFWTGVGATFEPLDPNCLDPNPSGAASKKCFNNGQSDPSTIHPLKRDGAGGYDVSNQPKKFEYYNWSYTHYRKECVDSDFGFCSNSPPRPGYTPSLFQAGFSENDLSPGQTLVDALDMGKDCWENLGPNWSWPGDNSCYAGWKLGDSESTDRGVRLVDQSTGDWDDGFYDENSLNFVMSIYDGGSSSDFGLNPCTVLTNSQDWIDYVRNDPPAPFPDLTQYQPEFACNFTEDAYSNLVLYKLSDDEREKEEMKQAFFDIATTVATAGVGSGLNAASKAAAAGTRLAKAVKAATAAWQTFDAVYSAAGVAAEFYVMGETIIKDCRELTGSNKDACWAQAVLPTMIGLAGDGFMSGVSGDLLHDLAKRVPPDNASDTSIDIPDQQSGFQDPGYAPKDFQAMIDNTGRRAEILTGTIIEHHAGWDAQGVEVSLLMDRLENSGLTQQAAELNRVLWEIPETAEAIDTFVDQLAILVASARTNTSEVDSLIDYVDHWNELLGLLESGSNRVDRSTIETDLGLHDYLARRVNDFNATKAAQEIEHYKVYSAFNGKSCS